MPQTELPAQTPLAPSVEKAYYRKCIQLKRRLNDVESANDEAKIRRVRLGRAIMKMRLERAFLLDELRKRMDYNVDASEGSGDEGLATPPPDRPHRDKRRRPEPAQAPPQLAASTSQSSQALRNASNPPSRRVSSQAPAATSGTNNGPENFSRGRRGSLNRPSSGIPGFTNGVDQDGTDDQMRDAPVNRRSGAMGERLSAGPIVTEDANGDRRVASSESGLHAGADG